MAEKKSRRQFLKGLAAAGAGMALAGCQQVVTVEKKVVETVEVEKLIEKEVVQTVEVEKVIEKEVVRTVVVEKVVTATPAPVEPETVTPQAPESRLNPPWPYTNSACSDMSIWYC